MIAAYIEPVLEVVVLVADSRPAIYSLLTISCIFWGANAVTAKYVVGQMTPLMSASLRFSGIAVILLFVILITQGKKALPPFQLWPGLIAMGFTGIFINNSLLFLGLQETTAINCSLLGGLNPALTAVLSYLFLKDQLHEQQWLGIIASLLGVVLLITKGSWETLQHLTFNRGDVMLLGSQLGWGIYSIIGRKIMIRLSPITTTAWTGLIGAICLLISALLYENPAAVYNLTPMGWLLMLYMVLCSGILSFYWWNEGVALVGPNHTAVFTNLIPLSGVLLSSMILHETIGKSQWSGALLILFGISLTTGALPVPNVIHWLQQKMHTSS